MARQATGLVSQKGEGERSAVERIAAFAAEHIGYEGGLDQPMSWDRVVQKFHWLSEAFADEDLRGKLIHAVQQLDSRPISDLMDLLAQVRPTAVFPKTRAGI
jgi:2-methylcitrate dehydratase